MKKMKKLLALLLALVMLVGLVACGEKAPATDPNAGQKPSVDEKPNAGEKTPEVAEKETHKFTVLTGVYGAATYTKENNALWDYIKENSGVELEMQIVPVGELENKARTVSVSGSLPNMMKAQGPTDPFWRDLENQGAFAPVEEYLEKYPALKEICSDSVWEWMRNDDGHIYFIPCTNYWRIPFGVVYRKDVFDDLGIPEPATIAELEAALETIKVETDMVPWSTWENHVVLLTWYHKDLMTSFGGNAGWSVDENDQLIPEFMVDGEIDFLFWLQDLRNRGLLDEEFGVSPDYAMGQVKWENGQVAVMSINTQAYADCVARLQKNFPDAEVGLLPGLIGPDGQKGGLRAIDPYTAGWYVSADTEDLDALFEYLNWSLNEGFDKIYMGFEGKTYTVNEQGTHINIVDDEREDAYKSYQFEPLRIMCSPRTLIGQFDIEQFRALGLPDSLYEYYMQQIESICSTIYYNRLYPTTSSPTSNEIGAQLSEAYINPYWPGLVLNANVTREEYDAAVQEWLAAGGQTIIDEMNANQPDREAPSYE